jgi:protein TIF31
VVDPTFAFLATPWQTGAAALAPTEQSARARWCVQSAASKASEAAAAASAQGKKPAAVVRRRQCADHTYDRNRAESDLTNETMGVSIGLGMACETQPSAGLVRDWNEELQCCREMPANTVHASIARSRALCKVLSDFETVATECAVAVAHGHVPPINPLDAPDAHVYVHNNVFFSLAVDGRGTYETCGGDAAAYSAASHDLRGVMELSRADVAGLHTLATAVVDYMGKRIVAQSIIPGILHGEAASSLVYGSVDHGKVRDHPFFAPLFFLFGLLIFCFAHLFFLFFPHRPCTGTRRCTASCPRRRRSCTLRTP